MMFSVANRNLQKEAEILALTMVLSMTIYQALNLSRLVLFHNLNTKGLNVT